jgi:late competence protein required for DNA uptake (superfamily II DNA/RNA helicase)
MILDREIYLKGNSKNIKYYIDLGYDVHVNEMFLVKIEHLTKGSTAKVRCECDNCGEIKTMQWGVLIRYVGTEANSKYYCKKCSIIKRLETNNLRYGGNSPTSSPDIIKKIKKTNIERYGVVSVKP